MKTLKQISTYLIWTAIALLLGIVHMWIVLEPNNESSSGLIQVFGDLIYEFVLIHIGLRIGSIIALLFILIDVFYLKRKLKNNTKSTIIRFLILLAIAVFVGITHYILEKVIDII